MISDGTLTTIWDRAGRILSYDGHSCAYDGEGRRIAQTAGGSTTRYVLDVQRRLPAVIGAKAGSDITHYMHGPLGMFAQRNPDASWDWMLHDGLGSVRGVFDGTLQSAAEYDPFGEPIVAPIGTAYGFTGELTDGNGLVYLRARYLAASLGTFASRDPWRGSASAPRTWNGYAWVEGNVVNRVDGSGMCAGNPFDLRDPSRDHACWQRAFELYRDYGIFVDTALGDVVSVSELDSLVDYSRRASATLAGGTFYQRFTPTKWLTDADLELGQARFRANLVPSQGITIRYTQPNASSYVLPNEPDVIVLSRGQRAFLHELGHTLTLSGKAPIWEYMDAIGARCPSYDPAAASPTPTAPGDGRFSYTQCNKDNYDGGGADELLEFARSDVHPVGGPLEDFADAFNYAILRFKYTYTYGYSGPLPA